MQTTPTEDLKRMTFKDWVFMIVGFIIIFGIFFVVVTWTNATTEMKSGDSADICFRIIRN